MTIDGVVLDYEASAIPVSTAPDRQSQAAAARLPGAAHAVVLWRDGRYTGGGEGDIFAATFASDGTVGPEHVVSVGTPRQTMPRLTSHGAGYLVTYRSETGVAARVLAQRVDIGGAPVDLEPVEVAGGNVGLRNPSAAWDGSEYLVVWELDAQIFGRRLGADLSFLDPAPVLLMPGNTPDVAARDGVFLVVTTHEAPPEIRQIYSRRVCGSDGAILDGSPVAVGFNYSLTPRVDAFADRWIVTWQRQPTHDNTATSVYAAFVDAAGAPTTPFVVDSGGKQPVVAVGANEAMFALVDRNGSTIEHLDILARRMTAAGTFLDPAAFYVSTAPNAQFDVAVGWTGAEYLTTFGDFRQDPQYDSKRGDLYAARVAADGTVVDPTGFPFANAEIPEMFADAAGIGGEMLLVGSIFRDDAGFVSYRIGLEGETQPATDAPDVAAVPSGFGLRSAFPNPFRETTNVAFDLPRADRVRLSIYDTSGRLVRTLVDGPGKVGRQTASWDGMDEGGRRAGAGVFFVRLVAGDLRDARRVVRLR